MGRWVWSRLQHLVISWSKSGQRLLAATTHLQIEEMEVSWSKIQESALKGLGAVYEQNVAEHHQESLKEYSLNASARKGMSTLQSSVGAFNPECNTKTAQNTLRLALNLHMPWHR